MAKLNTLNAHTRNIIHLMVTALCNRDCPHCCNKQYDLNQIPYVTDEELKDAHTLFITGGEPFLYANPNKIAKYYKTHYPNIKKVIVYTNAAELHDYILHYGELDYIDGVNVSIKTPEDYEKFQYLIYYDQVACLTDNRLYHFLYKTLPVTQSMVDSGFEIIHRDWQADFEPADDSIFRRV